MDEITPDSTAVLIDDLTVIRAALNSAYHQNTVLDLAEQYRKLHARPQQGKLTAALERALTLVTAYVQIGQAEADAAQEPSEEASADE